MLLFEDKVEGNKYRGITEPVLLCYNQKLFRQTVIIAPVSCDNVQIMRGDWGRVNYQGISNLFACKKQRKPSQVKNKKLFKQSRIGSKSSSRVPVARRSNDMKSIPPGSEHIVFIMHLIIDQFRYIKIHTWLRGLGE